LTIVRGPACGTAFIRPGQIAFGLQITLWLWFTVLFANFAEAWPKDGQGQTSCVKRGLRRKAHLLTCDNNRERSSSKLRSGDIVVVSAGDFIPEMAR